jgi:hypothetical protein
VNANKLISIWLAKFAPQQRYAINCAVEGVRTLADGLALVATVDTLVGGPTGEALGLALVCAGAAVPPWVTTLFGANAILHIQTILAFATCRCTSL